MEAVSNAVCVCQQGGLSFNCQSTTLQTHARVHILMDGLTYTKITHALAEKENAVVHSSSWSCMCKAATFDLSQPGDMTQRCNGVRQLYLFNNVKEHLILFVA